MISSCATFDKIARCRPHLGTFVRVFMAGDADLSLVDEAYAAVAEVDQLMSPKAPGRDIARLLNADVGEEIELAASTSEVLRLAEQISAMSGGAFDATRTRAGMRAAEFTWISENRIHVKVPGFLDLGGIAKGYAVDRALAVLRNGGAAWGLVDAGGDAAAFGHSQRFAIRHPLRDGAGIAELEISDAALATSSPQFSARIVDGEVQHHLLDPRSLRAGPVDRSVSVVAPSCAVADALTKVVFFEGANSSETLRSFGAQGWMWDASAGWIHLI